MNGSCQPSSSHYTSSSVSTLGLQLHSGLMPPQPSTICEPIQQNLTWGQICTLNTAPGEGSGRPALLPEPEGANLDTWDLGTIQGGLKYEVCGLPSDKVHPPREK